MIELRAKIRIGPRVAQEILSFPGGRADTCGCTIQSMGERLPQDVNRFLETHIDSVEQLEALVLLSEDPGRAWTAAEVSERLRTSLGSVEIRLAALVKGGLLQRADETFSYTATGVTDRRVRDLAWCFQRRRTAVIETIFSFDRGSA